MDKYTIFGTKPGFYDKDKTSRTVAQSPGFEDQKQTFRIILANRITWFYQMTQSLMSTDSKVLLNLPLCLSLRVRVPQHNSLSLTCAHDILLVTIRTLPISISSLLSRVHLHLVAVKRGANLFFITQYSISLSLSLHLHCNCKTYSFLVLGIP